MYRMLSPVVVFNACSLLPFCLYMQYKKVQPFSIVSGLLFRTKIRHGNFED
uniref:Uncharacterized protein n=1 Tax=Parascaris univalens TaxID=6257 RepID=A0A915C4I3_PARUN